MKALQPTHTAILSMTNPTAHVDATVPLSVTVNPAGDYRYNWSTPSKHWDDHGPSLNVTSSYADTIEVTVDVCDRISNDVLCSAKTTVEFKDITGLSISSSRKTLNLDGANAIGKLTAELRPGVDYPNQNVVSWGSDDSSIAMVIPDSTNTLVADVYGLQAISAVPIRAEANNIAADNSISIAVVEPAAMSAAGCGGGTTTYTISYNANSGTGAPASQTKTHGVTLTLSSTKPTRTGYTFVGWATSSSGAVVYAAGGTYTTNASVTLYAVWSTAVVLVTSVKIKEENKPAGNFIYLRSDNIPVTHFYGAPDVLPTNATNKNVTYTITTSSPANIATITSAGFVTASKAGTIVISADADDGGGANNTTYLTIYAPPTGIAITTYPPNKKMDLNSSFLFKATITPSTANSEVEWSSSDERVATVNPTTGVVNTKNVSDQVTIYAKTKDWQKETSVTITVRTASELKIYQSIRWPGKKEGPSSTTASDMTINDRTRSQLQALNPIAYDQAVLFDSSFIGGGTVRSNASALAMIFAPIGVDTDMNTTIRAMFTRFDSGEGGDFRNATLTNRVVNHSSTQAYINTAKNGVITYLKNNNGNPQGMLESGALKYVLSTVNSGEVTADNEIRPVFNTFADLTNGLTIALNDTWGNFIHLKNYTFDGVNFSGTLVFTIYDHFGLDDSDISGGSYGNKQWIINNITGFSAWYVLQHYIGCEGRFKPFVTYIETEVNFSGKI